jgi:hypothetical protein
MSREDAYAAYQDNSGLPTMRTSSVLFFDLLGIRSMSTSPDAQEYLRRLRPALEQAIDRSNTKNGRLYQASTWFTDNAVVGRPLLYGEQRESIIGGMEVAAAYLLLVCWGHGFLGRGAITFGDHYMDENFVFGPALIEAVELEKEAIWPRVVLGEDAVQAEVEHSRYYSNSLQSVQNSCLIRDEEGNIFVDQLGIYISEEDDERSLDHFLNLHKEATCNGLASNARESEVWLKWRWLADYQNHALKAGLREPDEYLVEVPEQRYLFADFLDPLWHTAPGSPWYMMDRQSRYLIGELRYSQSDLPAEPGVYALYRRGRRMYVGETSSLYTRIWGCHMCLSKSMKTSALRRNVAEHLGFATASDIYAGADSLTDEQVKQVGDWLNECEIAWIERDSKKEARTLERELKNQELPPLTKR